MGGKSRPRGPSREQLRLQREQQRLAEEQRQQIEEQRVRLAEQEEEAQLQAERERDQRISGQRAAALRRRGRSSLITSQSELGTSGNLG